MQCGHDRSGLLCGHCKNNYNLVLGSSQCKKCTNSYLALIILFALMGVVLVCLLLVSKLTVATGMLSGLVFYANIVGANHAIFLPEECGNPFSIFTAWLNIDFGIETCFYNGMDAYTKTWLQFVFPVPSSMGKERLTKQREIGLSTLPRLPMHKHRIVHCAFYNHAVYT